MARLGRGGARLIVGGSLLVAGLMRGPLLPMGAHAQWGNCLDDPKVWLSDGTEVDLSTTIAAPQTAVLAVSYVLHIGPGLTVNHVVYAPGNSPYAESLTVVNDAAPGHVRSETTALVLWLATAGVQATTAIKQGASGTASGTAGQDLVVAL
jgi:hypothetical protein